MTTHATAKFDVKNWDEKPYHESEGELKLTRASVRKAFHGDLEGESTLEYLMAYPGKGTTTFVGLEHFVGRLGDRLGSFVLQHTGTDDGHTSTGRWHVVPGSSTGALRGLRAEGEFSASRNEPQFGFKMDYDFG